MRRRPPLPRSAPPAPSDTTSAAPIRRPGTRPPDNPASSAPGRIATDGHSHAGGTTGPPSFCSGISLVDASGVPRPAGGPGPPRPGRRRRRQPACHGPTTGRRRRTPHSRAPREPPVPATDTRTTPTAAAGPGLATLPRTARSPSAPRISGSRHPTSTSSRSSEPTCCTEYSAAPNSSRGRVHLGRGRRAERRHGPPR